MKIFLISFFLLLVQVAYGQLSAADYSIRNIEVNTRHSEFGTSFFGSQRVVFASNKLDAKSFRKRSKHNKSDYKRYDLFKGYLNFNGEIIQAKLLENDLLTKYNEANVSFTPDLRHVYFTQNNVKNGKYIENNENWVNLKIYRASITTDGQWVNVMSLPFNNDDYSCAHPSVSEDGKILFFSSDMPGTKGQSDIFWVRIKDEGKYGKPQNIGSHVNSVARENFPYVDGNILYFSSDKPESLGGLDIFMVPLDNPDATPISLGEPINSKEDDFCFVIDRKNKKGFFSSNRANGKGDDDIYAFVQETEIKECKQIVTGEVRDKRTNEIVPKAIVSMYSHEDILVSKFPVKRDGKFSFILACRDNYSIKAEKMGYSKISKNIKFTKDVFSQRIILYIDRGTNEKLPAVVEEIENRPIINSIPTVYKNKKEMLDLPPILFDLDQYYITKEAKETLGKAIRILKDFPSIKIEFGAHTDSRASASYNLHLSQQRAEEVVNYIVRQGISQERVIGRGYGESVLVNQCSDGIKCLESEHLQNRRAEFVVIKQ